MPNWKRVVNSQNEKAYRRPDGWSTRAEIANELECSENRVIDILRPGIKAGDIERKEFPVWDKEVGRVVKVTMFRERPRGGERPAGAASIRGGGSLEDRVARYLATHPGAQPWKIVNGIRRRGEGLTAAKVAGVLQRMGT